MSDDHSTVKQTEADGYANRVKAVSVSETSSPDDYLKRLAALPDADAPDAEFAKAGLRLARRYLRARKAVAANLREMNQTMWLVGDLLARYATSRKLSRGELSRFVKEQAAAWGFDSESNVWQWLIAAQTFPPDERAHDRSIYLHAAVAMAAESQAQASRYLDTAIAEDMSVSDVRQAGRLAREGLASFGKPVELAWSKYGIYSKNGDGWQPLFVVADGASEAALLRARLLLGLARKEIEMSQEGG